jgi:two-component system, NtrC family, response regulator AtoC
MLTLLAFGPGGTAQKELPKEGSIFLGRAEDADLRIVDSKVSRRHARLHLGANLEIEDLESANGTFVRDDRLPSGARVPILPGEVVVIGSTVIMILRRGPGMKPRVRWPHSYLEARIIEECAHADKAHGTFALVRISLEEASELGEELITAALRPGDLLADYGPNQLEVLLADTAPAQAQALLTRLEKTLKDAGVSVRSGVAMYPRDATSAQTLFSVAGDKVLGGRPSSTTDVVLVDRAMRELYALAERVAVGAINVLITGETGVGKEVLAQRIHKASPRASKPFVALNCGALAETLLESELFGHERGAFSGAISAKDGLLEAASGGILFLDEVGEMSPALQTKLLRVLETQTLLRVGGTKPRRMDVRIVAATNRDLEEEIARDTFRQDLYFRLAGVTLAIPPLRERVDEIEPLARVFIEATCGKLGRPAPPIAADALALLRRYPWPGNIRELRNVVERAVLLVTGGSITREQLQADKMERAIARNSASPGQVPPDGEDARAWRDRMADIERQAIRDALERCGGNKAHAAEWLGMPRSTFFARLKALNVS